MNIKTVHGVLFVNNTLTKKQEKAAKELLRTVIGNLGGPRMIQRVSGVIEQKICNYISYGYVPLTSSIYAIHKATKVDFNVLSYARMVKVFGKENVPLFADILKSCLKKELINEKQYEHILSIL